MLDLKKILIVILVLFLILVVRKLILENFYDVRYLNSSYSNLDTIHSDLNTNIIIEFFYQDSCVTQDNLCMVVVNLSPKMLKQTFLTHNTAANLS